MTSSLATLGQTFRSAFGEPPPRLARAPGRVNLIGEHLDYNGLPVLPMALEQEVRLAFRPRTDGRVVLHNLDARFPPVEFTVSRDITPEAQGAWGDYGRAAAQAIWGEVGPIGGLEGVIGSSLPIAAGLSSSSALVVAVALALLDANRVTLAPERLMDVLARGERYVGVQGGGMDQAVSLGAWQGHALRIDFSPALRLTQVPVPPSWRFVVAGSLIEAAKAEGALAGYNAGVRQCREGLRLLSGGREGAESDYPSLLRRRGSPAELARAETLLDGVTLRRVRHVLSEAARVDQAQQAMAAGDAARFGALMDASHASLRDDFDASIPELDELVTIAREAGAAGARLTGAGFGGSVVALAVGPRAAAALVAALRERFYRPRGVADLGAHLFVARPAGGATVGPFPPIAG